MFARLPMSGLTELRRLGTIESMLAPHMEQY